MRLNSKKNYTVKSFLGVEKASSPLAIKEGRCTTSKNLLYRDGILKKRNGWREIYHFTNDHDADLKIYGIYPYENDVIIHAGQYLFRNGKRIADGVLPECVSFGYEHGDKLYIVCGGEFYGYDGVSFTEIYDSDHAYVPLTTWGISPISAESTEVKKESASVLTSRRKNTLIGARVRYSTYVLDTVMDTDKAVKIKGRTFVEYGSQSQLKCPYNALYSEAERLGISNIERVMGLDDENAKKLFTSEGVSVNLSLISEVEAFLKEPIKVTEAIFTGDGVPRMCFYNDAELIYDTQTEISGSNCDLTSALSGKVIDRIRIYGNSQGYKLKEISIFGKARYTGYVQLEYYENNVELNRSIKPKSITDVCGKPISLYANENASEAVGCNLFFENSEIGTTVTFDYITSSDGSDNFEIEFSQKDAKKLSFRMLEHCKTDTGSDVLALSDGKSICFATMDGTLYAPYDTKLDVDGITALSIADGGSLVAFGKSEAPTIELTKKDGSVYCALVDHASYGGAVNSLCAKTVNFDTLSLSNGIVFGSVSGKHRARRGEAIEKMIPYDMENAVAIEYDSCYYLFINGEVFVADTRLKSYDSGRVDSDFQYEWWYLDNIPASYVAKINGGLLIGREDGRVVSFYSGYSDVYYEKMHTGSYLFDENEDGVSVIYVSKEINVTAFDTVLLSGCYSLVCNVAGSYENEDTVSLTLYENQLFDGNGCLKIYPGAKLSLMDNNGDIIESEVISVDGFSCTVNVKKVGNNHTYSKILHKNQDTEYVLEAQENHYVLLDKYGETVNLFYAENATVRLKKTTPVLAEYETAPLLKSGEAKRLYGIDIELTDDTEGVILIEHETNNHKSSSTQNTGALLDMNVLDFNGLTFNTSLKKKCFVRAFERNFDYVTVKIKHVSNGAFGLISYAVRYA